MSLGTPQTITVNSVDQTLNEIESEGMSTTYATDDGDYSFKVSHQVGKRKRHLIRLDFSDIAEDPLTAENMSVAGAVYVVVDEPLIGFTDSEIDYRVQGLIAWCTAANMAKVLAGRH